MNMQVLRFLAIFDNPTGTTTNDIHPEAISEYRRSKLEEKNKQVDEW
jgi:hypothetical protein